MGLGIAVARECLAQVALRANAVTGIASRPHQSLGRVQAVIGLSAGAMRIR